MSTQPSSSSKPQYLMLIRGTAWQRNLSANEIENHLTRFTAWIQRLRSEGKATLGFPLEHEGKLITGKNLITDGPFIESKEAIAGLIFIHANSLDEAVRIVNDAPCLEYGQTLELRPVSAEPPESRHARRMRA
ncbi:MAG: hypothetical protein JO331_00225 [Verrucomicrobia bacterium]|nr:hypothetical protein [Verrucomicrobiota bacterium]